MADRPGDASAAATLRTGRPPRSVILDADSTLVGIEGIDWLAALRGPAMAERIASVTADAMAGVIGIEAVYETRLAAVAPTRDEIAALGDAYVASVEPGAQACLAALRAAGVHVVIVSAGLQGALVPLARHLGIPASDVHGVEVYHEADGRYRDFDRATPLTRSKGKATLVDGLGLPAPIVAVGDGMSDLEIKLVLPSVAFVAFTGFARRPQVIARADAQADSFDRLRSLLLSRP